MKFNIVNIAISVRSNNIFRLCKQLPLIGNQFAEICRMKNCRWPVKDCSSCSNLETCAWNLVFGQKLSSDAAALKRFQKPPLPFMFTFPFQFNTSVSTTEIECGLIVIGEAIPCLDILLDGFREILLNLGAEIFRLGSRDFQGIVHPLVGVNGINCQENLVVLSSRYLFDTRFWISDTLKINLISPLRLFEERHLMHDFNFSRFTKSLLRRISALAYYYGRDEFARDYKELARQVDDVICLENNFYLAKGNCIRTIGLMGHGKFRGNLRGLLPFLTAGMYLHVGKGSSYGMGMFELI